MALHATGKQADAHGFAYVSKEEAEASHGAAAYYSWQPGAAHPLHRARHAVGGRDGAVLRRRQHRRPAVAVAREGARRGDRAQRADRRVLATTRPARSPRRSPTRRRATAREPDEHGHDTNPGCDRDPRSSEPLHLGDELKELFLAHPHVVAFVAGHSHNNRVAAYKAESGSGFWEIKSPAIADWPTAAAADRADGELRRDALDLRDDARPRRAGRCAAGRARRPASAPPSSRRSGACSPTTTRRSTPRPRAGEPTDRNVELLLDDPRADAARRSEAAAAREAAPRSWRGASRGGSGSA